MYVCTLYCMYEGIFTAKTKQNKISEITSLTPYVMLMYETYIHTFGNVFPSHHPTPHTATFTASGSATPTPSLLGSVGRLGGRDSIDSIE